LNLVGETQWFGAAHPDEKDLGTISPALRLGIGYFYALPVPAWNDEPRRLNEEVSFPD
jgi:hypothetical protein